MKRLMSICVTLALLVVTGCEGEKYDDSSLRNEFSDLANRVAKLEQLCQQMNTNISSLQSIVNTLQSKDYVTGVTPIVQDRKVVGYTITFTQSQPITIYHGENGKDGENGATPIIGVKQDSDNIYYWTLNGDWLLDTNGNKIKAQGTDGAAGENAVTPQLKIEDNYWYVSYDNGLSWIQLGKATGENGSDGDSFFQHVDITNPYYVIFTLSDGSTIMLPRYTQLDLVFEQGSLIAMSANTSRDINYTVQSTTEQVEIEVFTSEDITAKIIAGNESNKIGVIRIKTGDEITEESRVVVFVANDHEVIMKKIVFDIPQLKVYDNTAKSIDQRGGSIDLEFLSNVECKVVIPHDAKNWITSTVSRALTRQSITINIQENPGLARKATVKVQSIDEKLSVDYLIEQKGSIEIIDSHEAVDLGLSVMWSTCNYGASSSSTVGGYFLWGDYTGTNYAPYYTAPNINSITGTEYDIVKKQWGGKWRLPTMAEFRELFVRCTCENATVDGVSGVKIIGPSGNSIFLPKKGLGFPKSGPAGSYQVTYTDSGCYMTGDSYSDNSGRFAYTMQFTSASSYNFPSYNVEFVYIPIRPVAKL